MEATVVNFLPYALHEVKPGLIPDTYHIPMAKNGVPGVLHIKDARSNVYMRDGKTFPALHPADQVAKALVEDYNTSQLEASHDAHPALFWVIGTFSGTEVLEKFGTEITEARKKQNIWFTRLIRRADDDWNKWKQHRMITDIQRHAASSLQLVNKEWFHTPEPEEFVKCPACSQLVEITAAICRNCGYITNEARAKELGLTGTSSPKPKAVAAKSAEN